MQPDQLPIVLPPQLTPLPRKPMPKPRQRKPRSNIPADPESHGSTPPTWVIESWLFRRLEKFGYCRLGAMTVGITTFIDRRERVRHCIIENKIGDEVIPRKTETGETYRQFFGRFYGEQLEGDSNAETEAARRDHADQNQRPR
jgi:hypothetical protein